MTQLVRRGGAYYECDKAHPTYGWSINDDGTRNCECSGPCLYLFPSSPVNPNHYVYKRWMKARLRTRLEGRDCG